MWVINAICRYLFNYSFENELRGKFSLQEYEIHYEIMESMSRDLKIKCSFIIPSSCTTCSESNDLICQTNK